ncbi:MAG: serine/threonine protein kinase [Myxococcales bacterium]|nr:serine/threonine protein kinase [Myxococcales bacterium]
MSETFPQPFGRYQLLERLAMGGMAELFLAEVAGAHGFAKTVVIKRILPHLAADEKFTEMFIAEAKLTAQLAHPKIAQTLELGTEDRQLFIVMEYIDGFDVLAMLRECAHRQVRVPPEISVYIVKEVLDALDFAHKLGKKDGNSLGIVHRDVSPSNVLLSKRGDVKLVDFGIAHAVAQDDQTNSGTLKGKYGYMSPEHVLGQNVSPCSDVFASGIVLAEMLMGRRLFAAANELDVLLMVRDVDLGRLSRFGEHIDESLAGLLRWALRKKPTDRYKDAAAFRDALDEWLFEKRHRVGTAQLAEIVNSLYDDALARRKQGLEARIVDPVAAAPAVAPKGGFPKSASGSISTGPPPAPGTARGTERPSPPSIAVGTDLASLDLAVPTGIDSGDRLFGAEPSSVIEVSLDDDGEIIIGARERGTETDAGPPLQDDSVEVAIGSIEFSTPDDDEVSVSFNATSDADAASIDKKPKRKLAKFDDDTGGTAYDTISAAVASVSPVAPDPASRDFDDSSVAGSGEAKGRPMSASDGLQKSEPPTPPSLEADASVADILGMLQERSALAVLYETTAGRKSGKLALSNGGVRKEIYFKRGVPEYVSSNIASELLGAYLVRMEVISSGELDMALAVMPHFGGKLGDTLVGLGLMKPLEVFRHLTRQVRSKIIEVCTWTHGRYEWFRDARCPRQAFPLDLDPLEVYGAGAVAMPRDALELWCDGNASLRPVAAPSAVAVPELFQVQGIRKFQESLDGSRTVTEIATGINAGDEGLHELRLLFLLVNTKLVTADSAN